MKRYSDKYFRQKVPCYLGIMHAKPGSDLGTGWRSPEEGNSRSRMPWMRSTAYRGSISPGNDAIGGTCVDMIPNVGSF